MHVVPFGGARSCWPHLQVMQIATSEGQIYNQRKYQNWNLYNLNHLVAKHGTNTSDTTFKWISVRKMILVIESIPWIHCASGNVLTFDYYNVLSPNNDM